MGIILFLHILGAVIWVGGMIAIRFAVHPVVSKLDIGKEKVLTSIKISGNLFLIVFPFILILLGSGLYMILAKGLTGISAIFIKEIIWVIMTINYIGMIFNRFGAKRAYEKGEIENAIKKMKIISNYQLLLNIILGIIAIYFGANVYS